MCTITCSGAADGLACQLRRLTPCASRPAQKLCQRCLKSGHFTFECKNERKYVSRPSRTALIANPALREKMRMSAPGAPGSLDVTKRYAYGSFPGRRRHGLD